MPLFAATIFCGAFLLFLVQPLIGKYILPWFGGGPGVWTTCLLFFQTMLLAGYAYAHVLVRYLKPKRQIWVHSLVVLLALCFLPIIPAAYWKPNAGDEPILRILLLLGATIGLPYLALSATGPLMQHWFTLARPGASPYRLYALSNAGSLLALVSYPFLFEPRYTRGQNALGWSIGLGIFAVLAVLCAWTVSRNAIRITQPATPEDADEAADSSPPLIDRFLWGALPGIASVLLVATTNKLCLDVAAIPFLWILPLGVYLLTFILCFDHSRWYARGPFVALLALSSCVLAYFLSISGPPLYQLVVALISTLFIACMVCNGELHRLRPRPERLTGYYLSISAGGALGSLFVTLGAPAAFSDYYELQLGLVLLFYLLGVMCFFQRSRLIAVALAVGGAGLVVALPALRADGGGAWYHWPVSFGQELVKFFRESWPAVVSGSVVLIFALRDGRRLARFWTPRMIAIPGVITFGLATVFVGQAKHDNASTYEAARNFYGAYKVALADQSADPTTHYLLLSNGGITHGMQFRGGGQERWPTTYYSESSGLGRAFAVLPPGPRRIGAVGLGTGTLAAYGRPGDTFRFYEINPAIVTVASRTFTYLRHTRATVNIALGDARLVMEREQRSGTKSQYDLLVLDAFSGDAIPVHLLTEEAMSLYLDQLRPDGIIAVHISNRHLDLRAAVEGLAKRFNLRFATISDEVPDDHWWLYRTVWVLLARDGKLLDLDPVRQHAEEAPDATAKTLLWTDDHASLFEVLK